MLKEKKTRLDVSIEKNSIGSIKCFKQENCGNKTKKGANQKDLKQFQIS